LATAVPATQSSPTPTPKAASVFEALNAAPSLADTDPLAAADAILAGMGFAGKSEYELAIESRLKRDSQAAAFRAGLGADGVSSLLHGTDLALLLPANCPRAAANRALLEEVMTPQQVRQFHQYLSAERAKRAAADRLGNS
jgi:hypothetical protein